jgi:hypothetical protein
MRLRLGLPLLLAVTYLGCGHKKPPPPVAPTTPPPPAGDTLRLKPSSGDTPHGKVRLLIEQEAAGKKRVVLNFDFLDEEKIESVSQDGVATVATRLADAVGKTSSGATEKMVDDFALALDELKGNFRRSNRGEIVGVTVGGVRTPLDENTARAILNAMYSAQRGAILPEGPVAPGATWKVETGLPPSSGFSGLVRYEYTFARKGGGVAVITCNGTVEGKSAGDAKKMVAKSVAEYRLEMETGVMQGSMVDTDTTVEQNGTVQVKQHVRVEWTLDDAGGK